MNLTDDQIRSIILRKKKAERKKKRIKRRFTFFIVILLLIIIVAGCSLVKALQPEDPPAKKVPKRNCRGIIYIDPGHGGNDPGAEYKGHREKDDTLKLSLLVRDELENKGFKVKMSREKDISIDRNKRSKKANKVKAKLMISIHRNRAENGNGAEAWIHSSDDPDDRKLAGNILNALDKAGLEKREVKTGTVIDPEDNYPETRIPKMPSCIVETGFLTNDKDNAIFDKHTKKLAKAYANAIEKTYNSIYGKDDLVMVSKNSNK